MSYLLLKKSTFSSKNLNVLHTLLNFQPKLTSNQRFLWAAIILMLGVTLRVLLPLRGFNYDIESWKIAADILIQKGNVYGETGRYNYGPIWFHILHWLDTFPGTGIAEFVSFRWKVAVFLTAVDAAIFLILLRHFNLVVAALFFLSPVSIIITGYHSQMDNLAVLFGLLAMLCMNQRAKIGLWPTLLLLGISLSTKHLLFFFPLWLAFKEQRWSRKILIIAVPYILFLSLFIPYWNLGQSGIINNVFLYRSVNNAPLWNLFLPQSFFHVVPPVILFFLSLFLLGLAWYKKPPLELYFSYLIAVVVFSSAISNQYLAIASPAIATQWNWAYALFTAYATVFLSVDWAGLMIGFLQRSLHWEGQNGYIPAIALLFLGLVLSLLRSGYRPNWKHFYLWPQQFYRWLYKELRLQIQAPW